MKVRIGLLVVLAVLVVFPKKAVAGEVSLGIYPPIMQITSQPPAKIEAPLTIQNLGEEDLNLDIVFRPFTSSQKENGEVEYLSQNDFFPENPLFFQHVQVLLGTTPIQEVSLAPKQQKRLSLYIEIPKNEPLSDYYFSILFISKAASTDLRNQSQNIAGIGTNILLSIGPKGKPQGVIEEFSAPFILEKGPVPFTVRVKNKGEQFFVPQGKILITNIFGQTVGKVDLLPVNILAGTIRAIPDSLQAEEESTPSAILNSPKAVWPESFLLGPYTANLILSLSEKGPILSKTIHFFAMPAKLLLGLVAALFILLLIGNRLKKRLSLFLILFTIFAFATQTAFATKPATQSATVQIKANVDPMFTFTISGITNGSPVNKGNTIGCQNKELTNSGIDSQASIVNLGKLSKDSISISAQTLAITTNAPNGYVLSATSNGHLANQNQFFIPDSTTPKPIILGKAWFGIHVCGLDVANSVFGVGKTGGGVGAKYGWPTATTPLILSQAQLGPIGNSFLPGSGVVSVEYAATIDSSIRSGTYKTIIKYLALPSF